MNFLIKYNSFSNIQERKKLIKRISVLLCSNQLIFLNKTAELHLYIRLLLYIKQAVFQL